MPVEPPAASDGPVGSVLGSVLGPVLGPVLGHGPGGVLRLSVRVQPGASSVRVGGVYPGAGATPPALVVAVPAAPREGAATRAALRALADAFGLARRDVVVVRGATSRVKLVELRGVGEAVLADRVRRLSLEPVAVGRR